MMKTSWKSEVASLVLLVAVLVATALAWRHAPAVLPVHWMRISVIVNAAIGTS
jgi:uncharacterized membrane protein